MRDVTTHQFQVSTQRINENSVAVQSVLGEVTTSSYSTVLNDIVLPCPILIIDLFNHCKWHMPRVYHLLLWSFVQTWGPSHKD